MTRNLVLLFSLVFSLPAFGQTIQLQSNSSTILRSLGEQFEIAASERLKTSKRIESKSDIVVYAKLKEQQQDLGTAFRVDVTIDLEVYRFDGELLGQKQFQGQAKLGAAAKARQIAMKQCLSTIPADYFSKLRINWQKWLAIVEIEIQSVPPKQQEFYEVSLRKALFKARVKVSKLSYDKQLQTLSMSGIAPEPLDTCQQLLYGELDSLESSFKCLKKNGLKSRWQALDPFRTVLIPILDFDYKNLDRAVTAQLKGSFQALKTVRAVSVSLDESRSVTQDKKTYTAPFALKIETTLDTLALDQSICRITESPLTNLELVTLRGPPEPALCYRWIIRARKFEVEICGLSESQLSTQIQLLDKLFSGLKRISEVKRLDDFAAGKVVFQLSGSASREQLQFDILNAAAFHSIDLNMSPLGPTREFSGPRLAFTCANASQRWSVQIDGLSPDVFAGVGQQFLSQVSKLAGTKIVGRSYDETSQRLVLNLDVSPGFEDLDQKLWECAWNTKEFQLTIAQTANQTLGFRVRRQVSKLVDMSLIVDNLRPSAFQQEGQQVVKLLKSIEGIAKVTREYQRDLRQMIVRFKSSFSPSQIDEAIWQALRSGKFDRSFAPDRPKGTRLRLVFLEKRGEFNLILVELSHLSSEKALKAAKKAVGLLNVLPELREKPMVNWTKHKALARLWIKQQPVELHSLLTARIETESEFEPLIVSPRISGNLLRIQPKTPKKETKSGVRSPDRSSITGERDSGNQRETNEEQESSDSAASVERTKPSLPTREPKQPLAELVAKLAKQTVHITAVSNTGTGTGTGFLVSSRGYILTNYHVVSIKGQSPSSLRLVVRLRGGKRFRARYLDGSEARDLALLKIAGTGLDYVTIADSSKVRPGEEVVIIGHPYGLDYTVTTGIISALNRFSERWMQTDASINPGNSGGPVFDRSGRVIAVSVSKLKRGTNLNFVIPINQARDFLRQAGVR